MRQRTEKMQAAIAAVKGGSSMIAAANANEVSMNGLRLALIGDGVKRPKRGRPPAGQKPIAPADARRRRQNRAYQVKCRGTAHSYRTEAENLGLFLLWEAGDLSEGQVAKALDVDRVTARVMRDDAKAEAMRLAEELLPTRVDEPGDWLKAHGPVGERLMRKFYGPPK